MENRILANDANLLTETLIFEMGRGVPRYSKLTLAEAFDIATIYNALGSSLQAGAARRIPVRLRVSRRAALVALVGSGWENEWSRVVQFACNACS